MPQNFYTLTIPIGPPVVIITAASYLAGAFGNQYLIEFIFLASGIILILNLISLTVSSNINIAVSVIISIISTFFIVSLFQKQEINAQEIHLIKTLGIIFWCFVGIEAMSHISHELKKENDFFKAVVIEIIIVALMYMAVTFSLLVFNAYGNENKNLHSLVIVASHIMPYADKIMAVVAFIICVIMALNLYVASLTRLSTTLNIDFKRLFFVIMGIILAVSILKFLFDFKIDLLITYSNGVFVLIYFLVSIAALKILKTKTSLLAIISMGVIISFVVFLFIPKRGLKNLEFGKK